MPLRTGMPNGMRAHPQATSIITTPTPIAVHNDHGVATIEGSSPDYDYMIVEGVKYFPTSNEGNSAFIIPVIKFDEPVTVIGNTTAMSTPHEIEYTLTFDRASAKRPSEIDRGVDWGLIGLITVGVLVLASLSVFIGIKMRVGFDGAANNRSANNRRRRRR